MIATANAREVPMLGSIGPMASITTAFGSTTRQLSDALTKMASGKKFQNAAEDLIGFLRAQRLEVNISGYEQVQQDLTSFKAYTGAAVQAASSIYESLTEMKDLATQYAGTTDTDLRAEYTAQFNSLRTQVDTAIGSTYVDGDQITTSGSVKQINLDPDGTATLDMNFTAISASVDIQALDITLGTAEADVQAEIDIMLGYMSEAKAFDSITDQQLNLTDTILNSKNAALSLITDIDEAEAMNNVLDLTLRQQAGIAMMAQGNMVQNSMAKLYDL